MVPMKNKVMQFPQPPPGQAEALRDEPLVIFSLDEQRFSIQWTITEVKRKRWR